MSVFILFPPFRAINRKTQSHRGSQLLPFEREWESGRWGHRRRKCGIRRFRRTGRHAPEGRERKIRRVRGRRSWEGELWYRCMRRWRENAAGEKSEGAQIRLLEQGV